MTYGPGLERQQRQPVPAACNTFPVTAAGSEAGPSSLDAERLTAEQPHPPTRRSVHPRTRALSCPLTGTRQHTHIRRTHTLACEVLAKCASAAVTCPRTLQSRGVRARASDTGMPVPGSVLERARLVLPDTEGQVCPPHTRFRAADVRGTEPANQRRQLPTAAGRTCQRTSNLTELRDCP